MMAGSTVRNSSGAGNMPPTTTMASGRWTWLPMAVEKAAGSKPTQAATQVMSTGIKQQQDKGDGDRHVGELHFTSLRPVPEMVRTDVTNGSPAICTSIGMVM